jgi:SAM-dependent methyltransferase
VGLKDLLKRLISEDIGSEIHDLDTPEAYRLHREIIERKKLLKEIYHFYFNELLDPLKPTEDKLIVEIGAGAYNTDEYEPRVITSNSGLNRYIRIVFDAQRMPFRDSSLDGVVMLNTLHHIPRARLLFAEISRTLKGGGVMAMVEPYFSPLGWLIYRHLHHEPVFKTPPEWEIPGGSVANQIMPYHIFTRDRALFEKDFPALKVEAVRPHTCCTHLISGGLTYRALVPDSMRGLVWGLEKGLTPLRRLLAMCMTVVVRKKVL